MARGAAAGGAGHIARSSLPGPDASADPPLDAGDDDEAWVPIPDENDEWRDLPGERSS